MSSAAAFTLMLAIAVIAYTIVLAGFRRGLTALGGNRCMAPTNWPEVSVVLPARNEADVLERTLDSLRCQDYPGRWEIIVVDDRSTDSTPEILRLLQQRETRLKVVTIQALNPASPKKQALAAGIAASTGEIVVTTDADCEFQAGWLRTTVSHMTEGVGVVAGLTVFDLPTPYVPFWQKVQWLDFFVQNFLAAGAAGAGIPGSCNGSNLAYRRQVYDQISGFGETAKQVSGDDVLFAQRVAIQTTWKMVFCSHPESVVRSLPVETIREMLHQRLRWASKGLAYRGSMMWFLFSVYAFYLMLAAAIPLMIFRPDLAPWLGAILLWRFVWDYVTVRQAALIFGQQQLLPYFLPYNMLQTICTPMFGIAGLLVPYRWKGDWYRTSRLPRSVRRRLLQVRRIVRPKRYAAPRPS
ncbi:glycosyltransferase [candidate division KSB1 bacterium]|nr:glycosyltransferase [candidate division KSB1 bacterium]